MQNIADRCSPLVSKSLPNQGNEYSKHLCFNKKRELECLATWESGSYFQKGNPYAITNYINEHLRYNPKMLGNKNQIRGIYTIQIDSYGEVSEAKTMRSCGIPEWDNQVLQIIKSMPRWTPAINYWKGEYCNSVWTVPVLFKNDSPTTPINPHTDVSVIGYSTCDTPVLMRYDATLTAHTTEPYLEVGVPVCYLNEQGDTIVPYGKYRYCQTDTIKKLGFVYEHKPKDALKPNKYQVRFYVFSNIYTYCNLTDMGIQPVKGTEMQGAFSFRVLESDNDSIRIQFENHTNLSVQPLFLPSIGTDELYMVHPLTRSGSRDESDYMRSCARLEAGEAMLFSIPVSWNVSRITDPNYKQRFSSGKLSPGKYKIGLQLEIYMNTEFEVK